MLFWEKIQQIEIFPLFEQGQRARVELIGVAVIAPGKDHFPVCESCIAGLGHIAKQGISGRINMIGNRIFGNRDILHSAGRAGGFGKIDRNAGPEYIMNPLFNLIDVRTELFVIPDRNRGFKLVIINDRFQVMLPSENGL